MIKWKDVLRALICCGAVLFMLLGALWAWETQWKIEAIQKAIEELRSEQRPLVAIDGGKYLTVFTQEKEVVIEVLETKEVDRSK